MLYNLYFILNESKYCEIKILVPLCRSANSICPLACILNLSFLMDINKNISNLSDIKKTTCHKKLKIEE